MKIIGKIQGYPVTLNVPEPVEQDGTMTGLRKCPKCGNEDLSLQKCDACGAEWYEDDGTDRDAIKADVHTIADWLGKKLDETITHCKFKNAWIPKGWACVEIKEFSEEIAREIGSVTGRGE